MVAFNKVVVAGNLTRDPEFKLIGGEGTAVCDFGLAVNRVRSKDGGVDFFDITAWRGLAETIANYKKKGDPILVEGRLQFRTWETDDGSKRSKVDIVAENVQFLGGASENGDGGEARQPVAAGRPGNARTAADVDPESDFDDIPF